MTWNQPGNSGQGRNLWGDSKSSGNSKGNKNRGGRNRGPPDLDDTFRKLSRRLGGLGGGKGTGSGGDSSSRGPHPQLGGRVVTIAATAIVIIWAVSGFCTIKEAGCGVATRFGKFSHLAEPDLNWRPTFIDEVKPVNAETVCELVASSMVLTSDEGVVHIETNMQYRVTDPEEYLYNMIGSDDNLRQATDSALRGVIGKCTMDRVLMEGRAVIRSDTQHELEETIRPYDMGVTPLGVNFQAACPPEEVKTAFDDAVATREDEQQYICEVKAYTSEVQPRTNGQTQHILEEARMYKTQIILEVQGEVARFAKLLPEHEAAPKIAHECLYVETMEKMLGNTRRVLVNDKGGDLMVLPLGRALKSGNVPMAKNDNGTSSLLHLPSASSFITSRTDNTSPTSRGDTMDQCHANAQRNSYQRQGE